MRPSVTQNKALALFLCILMLSVQWIAPGLSYAYTKPKEVTIALSKDSYPFHFLDSAGQPAGIMVDFWQKWSEKTGVGIRFVPSDWDKTLQNVKDKKVDLHAGCFYNKDRSTYMEYGFPIVEAETHIFYSPSLSGIETLNDLAPYRVGVMKGDYVEGYIKSNLPDATVVAFDSYKAMLEAAQSGKIRIFAADTLTALHYMSDLKLAQSFKHNEDTPLYTNYFYAAAQKGNTDLINTVNQGMAAITPSERKSIMDKWTAMSGNQSVARVAVSTDYPPFSYLDKTGKPTGLLIDLWNLWGTKTHTEVQFVASNWDDALHAVQSGGADIHSGLFETPDREKYLTFCRTLFPIESRLFYNPKFSSFHTANDLNGKKVGVEKGTYQETYLTEKYPNYHVVPFDTSATMLEASDNGLIDGFMEESMTVRGLYELQNKQYPLADIAGTQFSMDMMAAVSNSHPELVNRVKDGIDAILPDEWAALENKWISDPRDRAHSSAVRLTLNEDQKVWIKSHPTIRVGAISGFEPYEDNVSGNYTGISADYMRFVLSQAGIQPKVVFAPWDTLISQIGTDSGPDVLFNVQKTSDRARRMLFTDPYLKVSQVVATSPDSPIPNNLSDLSGLRVAVEKGFYKTEYLKKNPKIILVNVNSTLDALLAVSSGRADVYVGDEYSTAFYMDRNSIHNIRITTYPDLPQFEISVAVSPKMFPLKDILQKALTTVPEITRKSILDKYSVGQSGSQIVLSDSESEWLKKHPTVRLTVQKNWTPISFLRSDGMPSGIGYAIWERSERMLNFQSKVHSTPDYISAVETMMNVSSDVLLSAVKSPEKSKYMNFTDPYMESPLVLLSREGADLVSNLSAVGKQKIGVIRNSLAEDILKRDFPTLNYIPYSDSNDAYYALSRGQIDVLPDCLFSADYTAKNLGLKNIKVSGITDYKYEICFGVRKDWPELVSLLNKVIATMSASERSAIEESWFSQSMNTPIDWSQIIMGIAIIMGIMVSIVGITFHWNRKLQKEIEERKLVEAELITAKESADIANRSKSDFLANMSHEIRTPMNAVIGMANLLNNTDMTQRQQEYLSKISQATYNLLGIINDILDFSKIEAGKLSVETIEFSLDTLLDHVSDIISVKSRDKNVELLLRRDPDIPDRLYGDPLRLEQILINLANNAVKFTAVGEVEISVRPISRESESIMLQFTVRDTGIGMDSDRLDELFKPFTQFDSSTTRKYGGTGLGLSICRSLADLMGGRLWAECLVDSGCQFHFEVTLPFYGDQAPDYTLLDHTLSTRRILLVDDNNTALEIFSVYLNSFHVEYDAVHSGEEALEAVTKKDYDMILMDWRMPGLDGFQTTRRIRNMDGIRQPHIVMVTAYGQDKQLYSSELHLDGILHKPVSESVLFNTLQNVLLGNVRISRKPQHQKRQINPSFLSGQTILAVEDNLLNQQIILELLESAGASVHQVSNGEEALWWVEESKALPDAILMDLQMPQMDGYETTRRIREIDAYKNVPIFAMTADVMAGVYDKCILAGMNDYISKPISLEELFGKLGQWLNLSASAFTTPEADFSDSDGSGESQIMDFDGALRRLGSNRELMVTILKKFIEQYDGFDALSDRQLESGNPDSASRFFHTLKGTAGSIGGNRVCKLAENMEKLILKRDAQNLEPLLAELKMEHQLLMEHVRQALDDDSPSRENSNLEIPFSDLLQQLAEPLRNRKPGLIDDVLNQVNPINFQQNQQNILNRIQGLCSKYRYKDALTIVEEWLKSNGLSS